MPVSKAEVATVQEQLAVLRQAADQATTEQEVREVTARIAHLARTYRIKHNIGIPTNPLAQALEIDNRLRSREHLSFLSKAITANVRAVERGQNRNLAVSLPPRAGKSTLTSLYAPLWLLRRHPEWSIVLTSYDSGLTSSWARRIRTVIEEKPDLGIALAPDGGAGAQWNTIEGGGMYSTSVRGALTGRGARVMIIDDPVKDFVEAHSLSMRQGLWDWWLSVASTRLEPPYLVLVVMTRWHEDDFIGRLMSPDYEGNPKDWNLLSLPALAEEDDPMGRDEGEPLLSPLLDETKEKARNRWIDTRQSVGTYIFSAMYQQRPAPARGAIFDTGWWRFWTRYPEKATEDGRIIYLDPETLTSGTWCDSWDCNFKSSPSEQGGWVVGQRWVRSGPNRYLIAQQRERWSFTQTLAGMNAWADTTNPVTSPCGHLVHTRLIEERANGAAIIDVMKESVSGLKPINPTVSKESRARAVTPEAESGNVFLPHPSDAGNEWVQDLLSELRNFPNDAHDDQVDALTQALAFLRVGGRGRVTVPGTTNATRQPGTWGRSRDVVSAAYSDINRRR